MEQDDQNHRASWGPPFRDDKVAEPTCWSPEQSGPGIRQPVLSCGSEVAVVVDEGTLLDLQGMKLI